MDSMREVFDRLYAPDRYYRLAASDIKQRIVREVQKARREIYRDPGAAQDVWAGLDLIDVIGIPNLGILVFFRLSQTGSRINVYVADVLSFADIDRARGAIDAGRPADEFLGEGYAVFDKDFVFSFPAFAAHMKTVISVSANEFFAIDSGRKGEGLRSAHPGLRGPTPEGPRAGDRHRRARGGDRGGARGARVDGPGRNVTPAAPPGTGLARCCGAPGSVLAGERG